jgi:hypothetical protein
MSVLQIPNPDPKPWPTLGPQVWDWMLENLVYGPGDLRGVPLSDHPPDEEFRGLLYRMYEVFPRDHERAGRRRFRRVALSKRKGTAKTEQGAWIAAAELHQEAPVRCDGWRRTGSRWDPVGAPVRDPYIPMVAYTEEQTEDLAFKALYVVLSEGPLADDFDIGLERIVRAAGDGKAVPLATAPDARDGARTTFQHFDETGRLTLPRLIEAHQTMQANLVKRKIADPWSLETTFAFAPGSRASPSAPTTTPPRSPRGGRRTPACSFSIEGLQTTMIFAKRMVSGPPLIEASGPAAEWSDIDGIVGLWRDPTTDRAYFERAYTNRLVQLGGATAAFMPAIAISVDRVQPEGATGPSGGETARPSSRPARPASTVAARRRLPTTTLLAAPSWCVEATPTPMPGITLSRGAARATQGRPRPWTGASGDEVLFI